MSGKLEYVAYGALALLILIGGAFGFLATAGLPLDPQKSLGDGRVTMVIENFGPISIAAYLVDLGRGRFALIDSGMDPMAGMILAELQMRGRSALDVEAIFLTHGHDDHAGGNPSFPRAKVYQMGSSLVDGQAISLGGTTVEAFAVPGHTVDSAAFLTHGVLFLGDSAGAARNWTLAANALVFTDDGERSAHSLHALATRLADRGAEVRNIAFGHQGALDGLAPLLAWAERDGHR